MKVHKLSDIRFIATLRAPDSVKGVSRGAFLSNQILAGVTLAALMIPLNIGYAQIAGLPPVAGLYAAIVPMIIFSLFSTSPNMVAGPDAAIVALIGSALAMFAVPDDPYYQELAFGLALLSAVIFAIFWFFRMGFLANFLSRAVLVGFISGLGVEILTSQVQKIMAIHVESEYWLEEVWLMIRSIPQANIYSVLLGVGAVVLIRLLKRIAPKIPGALVALIVGTIIVSLFRLEERGVTVLGEIPSGLPSFHVPQVALIDYLNMIPIAVAIVAITMAEGLLLIRKYANQYGDRVDPDMEFLAFGAANVAAAFTGSLVIGSSASRTAALDGSGMRSQIPSLAGAAVVAIVLLFLTDLLALVPNALLAGIVASAILGLIELAELSELRRQRRSEFNIAMVCLFSVLAIGPLPAVVIAFLISAIDVVQRAARPNVGMLQMEPSHSGFFATSDPTAAMTTPGLVFFRFGAELFFANANYFVEQVKQVVDNASEQVKWFALDAEAVNDIDTTGAEALEQVLDLLDGRGITLAITRATETIPALLDTYELPGEDRRGSTLSNEPRRPGRLLASHRADRATGHIKSLNAGGQYGPRRLTVEIRRSIMVSVIGDILPLALGVTLSPIPIIAVILMLFSKNARGTSLGFLLGWFIGVAGIAAVVVMVADPVQQSTGEESSLLSIVVHLVLGPLLLALAYRNWKKRPKPGDEVVMPKWMEGIETMTAGKALGMGA